MVSWFTRRREAVEVAPAPELVEDVDGVDAVMALLAAAHLPTESCSEQLGGVPAGVRAAADDRTLAVVVEEAHPPRAHDRALALALGGAGGRRIALLIPGNEPDLVLATRARAAMLTGTAVDLYTYDGARTMVHPPLSERMLRGGAAEPEGLLLDAEYRVPLRLVPVAEAIEEWADDVRDLTPRHLKSARAWVCEGKRVLSMRAVRAGLRVFAGLGTPLGPTMAC